MWGCKPEPPKFPSPQFQPRHERIEVDDLVWDATTRTNTGFASLPEKSGVPAWNPQNEQPTGQRYVTKAACISYLYCVSYLY